MLSLIIMYRRKGRAVARGRGRVRRALANLRTRENWHFPRGRFDPPRVVDTPAWPLVIEARIAPSDQGLATYTIGSIRQVCQGQLGLGSTFGDYSLRFTRIDVWTLPADVISAGTLVALRIADFVNTSDSRQSWSSWQEDCGTTARPGHCHAVWPYSQQQIWHTQADGVRALYQLDHPAQFSGLVHVHVYIMFNSGDVVPTYRRFLKSLEQQEDDDLSSSVSALSLSKGEFG